MFGQLDCLGLSVRHDNAAAGDGDIRETRLPPRVERRLQQAQAAEAEPKAKAEHKTGNTVEMVVNDEGYPFQLEYRTDTTPRDGE